MSIHLNVCLSTWQNVISNGEWERHEMRSTNVVFLYTQKKCPLGRVREITKTYNFQGYLSSSAEFLQVKMIISISELKENIFMSFSL